MLILAVFLGFFVASCEKKSTPSAQTQTAITQSVSEQNATSETDTQDEANVAQTESVVESVQVTTETTITSTESVETESTATESTEPIEVVTQTEVVVETLQPEQPDNAQSTEVTPADSEVVVVESESVAIVPTKTPEPAVENPAVAALRQKGVVRIGVFGDKPPFGYIDSNGANAGYDIAFAKRIAQEIFGDSSKIDFVLVEAANRVEFLRADKVDIILANFTQTPEREQQVDFTLPYMKVALGVVVPQDTALTTPEQLQGKTLIVNKGTTADAFFTKNYPDLNMLKYDQNTEAFAALLDSRGDALAHDNTLLFAWVKENPQFKVAIKELGNQDVIAAAVQKGNTELRQFIDDLIVQLANEQFFHKAYDETLKAHFTDDIHADNIVIEGGKR